MKPASVVDKTVYQHYRDETRRVRRELEAWLESRIVSAGIGTMIGDPLL
jgi:hypothetical protein